MDAEYSIVFLFLFVLKMPSIKYIHHYYHHQPSTSCCICRQYEHAECGAGGRAALGTQAHWGRGARSQGEQGQPRQQGGGEGARGGPHQLHQRQGCWHHVAPGEHLSPVCRAAALHCTVLVRRYRCCSTPPAPACTWCSASSGGGWAAPGAWPGPARSTAATRQHSARWGQQPTVVEG